ncbi:DUF4384 domain-containing protein [Myxococcus sp. AS-1-15]|uniref:DUF4384 domain-containing protein n=2 Tax=Myxococcus TaxID=32 RepID=UPI001CC0C13C|nr:DUF4384 domain-containing protein [Myxococcus sp. AS-1-15]MBZ4398114.1 DUF4384 domain-containing protein [Myxococcus sp. AS-1-15]
MSPSPLPRFPGVPELLIERYLCGEVTPEEARSMEEAAREMPLLAAHLEERRAAQSAFVRRRPFTVIAARLHELEPAPVHPWARPLRWAQPALALCALLALGLPLLRPAPDVEERIRVRGGLTTRLHVKRGDAVFEQALDVALRPGDRVRLEVEDPVGGALYVLAVDSRGQVTPLHGFAETGGALRLEPGRMALPGSLELDAGPEREALVFVLTASAPEAPSPTAVRRWLEQAARTTRFPPTLEPLPSLRHVVRELRREQP